MKIFRPNSQSGFSLIEAVLVTVLMLFALTVFGAFMLRFTQSAAQYSEVAKKTSDAGLTTQTVIQDLERVGANLTLTSNHHYTGQINVPFYPNIAYQEVNGRFTRVRGATHTPLSSTILWGGKGELKWQGNSFNVVVRNSTVIHQFGSYGGYLMILEDGILKAQTYMPSVTNYSMVYSTITVNGESQCRTRYLAGTQQIYESAAECTTESKEINIDLQIGSSYISDIQLNAAEITMREAENTPVRLALMPMYEGKRPTVPVLETNTGFVLFGGDDKQDAMFLRQDTQFLNDEGYLTLNKTDGLRIGDVVLVCDFLNNRSILLYVEEDADDDNDVLALPIVDQNTGRNGFEKLYSDVSDFEGHTFPQGSRVVRLTAPVEYNVQSEGNLTSLYRRIAGSPWELVVPNVQNYVFTQDVQQSSINFGVSFDVLSEGIESSQTAQPVRISVNPRALNRTFDAR